MKNLLTIVIYIVFNNITAEYTNSTYISCIIHRDNCNIIFNIYLYLNGTIKKTIHLETKLQGVLDVIPPEMNVD